MDEQNESGRIYMVINVNKPRPFTLHVISGDRHMSVELTADMVRSIVAHMDAALLEYVDYWEDRMN